VSRYSTKIQKRLVARALGPISKVATLLNLPESATEGLIVESVATLLAQGTLPHSEADWDIALLGVARQLLVRDRMLADGMLANELRDPMILEDESSELSCQKIQQQMHSLDVAVVRRLFHLNSEDLAPFWAYYSEGKSIDEIAEMFNVTPGEAQQKLRQLRQQFNEFISSQRQKVVTPPYEEPLN